MIYTITLNPSLDYVLWVDKIAYEVNRAEKTSIYFGGKGINVSAVLKELEVESIALGFVGGFSGEKLESLLENEKIKSDFVHIMGETRINVKIRCKNETDFNAEGPEVSESEIREFFDKLERIKEGDWVVLAGSIPKSFPQDIYERIMQTVSRKGALLVVDAAGDLLKKSLEYKPFLIKPNHHELLELFDDVLVNEEQIVKYARILREKGAKNVLVSLAEYGAVLVDENEETHSIENAEGTLINSVGCGDSMLAGFIAGYIKTGDYSCALGLGTACGNATAYSEGLAKRKDIDKYIQ